jgi:hypothetical protein
MNPDKNGWYRLTSKLPQPELPVAVYFQSTDTLIYFAVCRVLQGKDGEDGWHWHECRDIYIEDALDWNEDQNAPTHWRPWFDAPVLEPMQCFNPNS